MSFKIAEELLKLAKGLMEYDEATERLGERVKKVFGGYPWRYDKRAKSWAIMGKNVQKFYDRELKDDDIRGGLAIGRNIAKRLGGEFEDYKIIADAEDSYILITLD